MTSPALLAAGLLFGYAIGWVGAWLAPLRRG